jgi:hypothetical protein
MTKPSLNDKLESLRTTRDSIQKQIDNIMVELKKPCQGKFSISEWEKLLSPCTPRIEINRVDLQSYGELKERYMIYTEEKINELGRLNDLHDAGYYVDAIRINGNRTTGSEIWINKF